MLLLYVVLLYVAYCCGLQESHQLTCFRGTQLDTHQLCFFFFFLLIWEAIWNHIRRLALGVHRWNLISCAFSSLCLLIVAVCRNHISWPALGEHSWKHISCDFSSSCLLIGKASWNHISWSALVEHSCNHFSWSFSSFYIYFSIHKLELSRNYYEATSEEVDTISLILGIDNYKHSRVRMSHSELFKYNNHVRESALSEAALNLKALHQSAPRRKERYRHTHAKLFTPTFSATTKKKHFVVI